MPVAFGNGSLCQVFAFVRFDHSYSCPMRGQVSTETLGLWSLRTGQCGTPQNAAEACMPCWAASSMVTPWRRISMSNRSTPRMLLSSPICSNIARAPPRPQSRLFAYVYAPGTWIGCKLCLRSELGDLGDPRWSAAAAEARRAWDALFPQRDPYRPTTQCNTFPGLRKITDG
jgi:hypothetical protein